AIFPPSLLEPSASPGDPGRAAGPLCPLGHARATAGGQRHALGLAGRSAHGLDLLAGGPGGGRGPQPTAASSGQWGGGTLPGRRQGLGRTPDLHLGGPTGGAHGGNGPLATRARSVAYGTVAVAAVSPVEALGTALHGGVGGPALGRASGLGVVGVVCGPSAGRSAGEGLAVRSAPSRGVVVGGSHDLG